MTATTRLTAIRWLLLPALAICSTASGAQVIRDTVNGEGARAPVRGAVVTLLDVQGTPTDRRVLTDNDGAFAMRAPSAGSWMVEVRAQWTPPNDWAGRPVGSPGTLRALTDWRGEFLACDVPAGASASFRTTTGEAQWSFPIKLGGKLNVLEIAADSSGAGRR